MAIREVDIQTTMKTFEGILDVWFKGIKLEIFPSRVKPDKAVYFTSLLEIEQKTVVNKIRISEAQPAWEKLGKVADSKALDSLVIAAESINCIVAFQQAIKDDSKFSLLEKVAIFGAFLGLTTAILETLPKVGKTPIAAFNVISYSIDTFLEAKSIQDEISEGDYDAALSQVASLTGAATITIGSAFVLKAACIGAIQAAASTGAAIIPTLLSWGAGLSASGVGSTAGAVLLLSGATIYAAGEIAYIFTDDHEIEQWMKYSPWGNKHEWNFSSLTTLTEKVDILNSLIYSFKCEVWHDRLHNRGGIRVTSPFFRHDTKIIIEEMKVIGNDGEETICQNLLVDEKLISPKYSVEIATGENIDIVCTVPHKSKLKVRKKAYARIYVDLFGNGEVVLPRRGRALEKIDAIVY